MHTKDVYSNDVTYSFLLIQLAQKSILCMQNGFQTKGVGGGVGGGCGPYKFAIVPITRLEALNHNPYMIFPFVYIMFFLCTSRGGSVKHISGMNAPFDGKHISVIMFSIMSYRRIIQSIRAFVNQVSHM